MIRIRRYSISSLVAALVLLAACGKESPSTPATPDAAAPPAAATPAAPAAADAAASAATASPGTFTPEVLEQLAAPIALYPDVILGHVLVASTNPQQVLDAGNWLIEHQDLQGAALDDAASKLGLSASTRALLQFPETVDMMCMKMEWTTQLGEAFTADQAGVLDAVQRLRVQAKDVGNLATSDQLAVKTETQDGEEIVTVAPANPEVVYVPQYDPVAVYAPPPATIPPPTTIPVQGATTTTTTTTTSSDDDDDDGHSTGALITTGLLAFGAGILVNEVFDDDDDWDDYHPNYYGGGMYYGGGPYYPPPPGMYRPPYGGGYYPSHHYNRGNNYQRGFNNNTIIVNNGGQNYWNDFNRNSPRVTQQSRAKSPITQARPNRPELAELNRTSTERARASTDVARNRSTAGAAGAIGAGAAAGAGVYKGATAAGRQERDRMVQNSARPTDRAGTVESPKRPKGEYAGAKNRPTAATGAAGANRNARDAAQSSARNAASRETPRPRPSSGAADRGRPTASASARDTPRPERVERPTTTQRPQTERPAAPISRPESARPSGGGRQQATAFEGAGRSAASERSASQRGRASSGGAHRGGNRER